MKVVLNACDGQTNNITGGQDLGKADIRMYFGLKNGKLVEKIVVLLLSEAMAYRPLKKPNLIVQYFIHRR